MSTNRLIIKFHNEEGVSDLEVPETTPKGIKSKTNSDHQGETKPEAPADQTEKEVTQKPMKTIEEICRINRELRKAEGRPLPTPRKFTFSDAHIRRSKGYYYY